ncbi:MAG: hypothetical protein KY475_25510 [Planctomycetes bacterium]|nr:hypothetical protein [Planctomycetota bacterium]
MAGFLYYLPSDSPQPPKLAEVQAAGLGYAFDQTVVPRGCQHGPDGGCGHTLSTGPELPGYHPERQIWRKIPGLESGAWVGFETDKPPGPEELVRSRHLDGHWVELNDGQRWLIPCARQPVEENGELVGLCRLPAAIGMNESGEWTRDDVDAKYADLWAVAVAYWNVMIGAANEADDTGLVKFDLQGAPDAVTLALATNYRIGRFEVAMLGLLNDETIAIVLQALIDWPTVRDWIKKNATEVSATDTSDSGSGAPD